MNEKAGIGKQEPSSKLIMVVDDDESLIEYVTMLLQKEGFRTKSARDGKIALKRVKEEKTDLMLLDMMMPNTSGFEVIRQLQAEEETRNMPVFVITARRIDKSTWDVIRQEPNVKEIVTKPINPYNFRKLIHTMLNTISPQEKIDREAQRQNESKKDSSEWDLPPAFRDKEVDQ